VIKLPKLQSRSLCNSLTVEAENIWKNLKSARGMGIVRDEETITNDLLLNLQRSHPRDIVTVQFRKPEEQFTGTDWEWWLTDDRRWLGLLVQAKILNFAGNKYSSIKYRVGKSKRPQIDILLEQAEYKGIDPIYFFYNYSARGFSSFQWNCGSYSPAVEQLGCTVAHANAVNGVVGQGGVGLPSLNPISFPMRCLVCCPVLAGVEDTEPSLPERAYGVTRTLERLSARWRPPVSHPYAGTARRAAELCT
jgi:hypothetical protein